MVLHDVFVAFVGFNNNNIGFGLVSSDISDPAENVSTGANTDIEYRIDASLSAT